MGAGGWIEYPLDILLKKKRMNLFLVPLLNRLSQVLLSPHKITSVVGSDLLRLTSSCNESSQRVQERICIQTMGDFDADCSHRHTGEQDTVLLPLRTSRGPKQSTPT